LLVNLVTVTSAAEVVPTCTSGAASAAGSSLPQATRSEVQQVVRVHVKVRIGSSEAPADGTCMDITASGF
jgi:hypothetical protein